MNNTNLTWNQITVDFNKDIRDALQQQHHAVQFLALVGRHLIPQKPDDSNTNMEYNHEGNMILGNPLSNGWKIVLNLTYLNISILNNKLQIQKEISLTGKTKQQIFSELREALSLLGVDVTALTNELHYELPIHPLDNDGTFSINKKSDFIENANYRQNAKIIINEIAKSYSQAEPVKIWPHHFDTGSFIPVSHSKNGDLSQSIGIGWAIPDNMVNEPYFYLSFWSEKPIKESNTFTSKSGQWMMPEWNGAILKHSEILPESSPEKQYDMVMTFFQSGLKQVIDHLKS